MKFSFIEYYGKCLVIGFPLSFVFLVFDLITWFWLIVYTLIYTSYCYYLYLLLSNSRGENERNININ